MIEFLQQGYNPLLLAVALASGLALLWPLLRPTGAKAVSPLEATLLMNRQDALVLDVRDHEAFVAAHLPEARNIPAGALKERLGEIEKFKERPLILCSATSGQSAAACAQLRATGFTSLHNLAGGIEAWRTANLPVKKGAR